MVRLCTFAGMVGHIPWYWKVKELKLRLEEKFVFGVAN